MRERLIIQGVVLLNGVPLQEIRAVSVREVVAHALQGYARPFRDNFCDIMSVDDVRIAPTGSRARQIDQGKGFVWQFTFRYKAMRELHCGMDRLETVVDAMVIGVGAHGLVCRFEKTTNNEGSVAGAGRGKGGRGSCRRTPQEAEGEGERKKTKLSRSLASNLGLSERLMGAR